MFMENNSCLSSNGYSSVLLCCEGFFIANHMVEGSKTGEAKLYSVPLTTLHGHKSKWAPTGVSPVGH